MSIASDSTTEQLIAQLYTADGKAEIVEGQIVMMSPAGDMPNAAAFAIAVRLREYARQFGGRAYTDNAAFIIDLPHRKSFSPDAAYHTGPRTRMKFLKGAPEFAIEVRSEGDYGPSAERKLAAKRADYFAAGTKEVWDVDLLSDDIVRVYRADSLDKPTVYRRGETAEAEPAVPGWIFPVDELFD